MNLSKTEETKLIEEATESLVQHCALESVTAYVVEFINKKYHTTFGSTLELVEFCQEANAEIIECPNCGWYTDYLTFPEDDDGEVIEDHGPMCVSCVQYI